MDTGSCLDRSGAQVVQNVRKSVKTGGPGVPFGSHPGVRGRCFSQEFTEKCDLCISMPLSNRIATCAGPGAQIGATGGHFGPKVTPDRSKVDSKGQVGVEFGRSVRGPLSELWKLPGNRPRTAGAQPRIKSRQRSKSI